jgi:hypothetical protein
MNQPRTKSPPPGVSRTPPSFTHESDCLGKSMAPTPWRSLPCPLPGRSCVLSLFQRLLYPLSCVVIVSGLRSPHKLPYNQGKYPVSTCLLCSPFQFTPIIRHVVPIVGQVPALLAVPVLGMSMGILQEPIRHGECVKRNATVKLYPKTPTGYDRYNNPSSRDLQPATALNIPPNTCLSGDYPLSQNLEIVNVPICADGSSSTWSIFSNRGCTGRPRQGFHAVPMASSSWPTTPYYWSLIFRCGASSSAQVTSDIEHLDAVPPAGPSKGVIQQGALKLMLQSSLRDRCIQP